MRFLFLSVFTFLSLSCATHASLRSLNNEKFPLQLPELLYTVDSLTEAIDQETMSIHHGRHHRAYVDNANKALPGEKRKVIDVLKKISTETTVVRNNVGGHWNHSFFWLMLTPDKERNTLPKELENEIKKYFGSVEQFKTDFEKAGASQFGSGWVWLVRTPDSQLKITTTANQDNPLMDTATVRGWPILGIDVWEHSYYLKYQNKRADYLKSIWKIIDWHKVQQFDQEARRLKL